MRIAFVRIGFVPVFFARAGWARIGAAPAEPNGRLFGAPSKPFRRR
jgi:hypothetical protein